MSFAAGQSSAPPFVIAGTVMIVGLAVEVATVATLALWPWMVAAGLAVGVGLFRLTSRLDDEPLRTQRTGRVLARIAGTGAALYVTVTLSFLVAAALRVRLPTFLEALFIIGALGFLTGAVLGCVLIGSAFLRRGVGPRGTGILLLIVGLLLLSPLPDLFGLTIPDAMPFVSVACLAVVLLLLSHTLRSTAPGHPRPRGP